MQAYIQCTTKLNKITTNNVTQMVQSTLPGVPKNGTRFNFAITSVNVHRF